MWWLRVSCPDIVGPGVYHDAYCGRPQHYSGCYWLQWEVPERKDIPRLAPAGAFEGNQPAVFL
jgi:hypothetical protein